MEARRWLFGILVVISSAAFISGMVAHGSADTQMSVYSVAAWPVYLLTYAWMKADARARGSTPPPGAIPLIPVLLQVAIPYYLLATRRRWHKVLSLCLLAGYVGIGLMLLDLGEFVGQWLVT
ncbi:MAG: hypothetical protein JSR66_29275 [Proteobacteria bacterium]|nr:hypothetical protein [Pseudomonadota bacterium]